MSEITGKVTLSTDEFLICIQDDGSIYIIAKKDGDQIRCEKRTSSGVCVYIKSKNN